MHTWQYTTDDDPRVRCRCGAEVALPYLPEPGLRCTSPEGWIVSVGEGGAFDDESLTACEADNG